MAAPLSRRQQLGIGRESGRLLPNEVYGQCKTHRVPASVLRAPEQTKKLSTRQRGFGANIKKKGGPDLVRPPAQKPESNARLSASQIRCRPFGAMHIS